MSACFAIPVSAVWVSLVFLVDKKSFQTISDTFSGIHRAACRLVVEVAFVVESEVKEEVEDEEEVEEEDEDEVEEPSVAIG